MPKLEAPGASWGESPGIPAWFLRLAQSRAAMVLAVIAAVVFLLLSVAAVFAKWEEPLWGSLSMFSLAIGFVSTAIAMGISREQEREASARQEAMDQILSEIQRDSRAARQAAERMLDQARMASAARGLDPSTATSALMDSLWSLGCGRDLVGTPRILWVDDNPAGNAHERAVFEGAGIPVDLALSTEQALALASVRRYSLVISDMARGDVRDAGHRLLAALRRGASTRGATGVDVPFIVYAGDSSPEYQHSTTQLGGDGNTNDPAELFALVFDLVAPSARRRMISRGSPGRSR